MALETHQKERVIELRRRGHSFGEIAEQVDISRNTIKSLCHRLKIEPIQLGTEAQDGICLHCQIPFTPVTGKKFCSTNCRLSWWHANPQRLNRKAIYTFTCPNCQQPFSAYGNSKRKCCTHACYIRHRFGTRGGKA